MNENDTIIIVQDDEELTQCQLQYLLEWQYFGEHVCFKWAHDNYCLTLKLSTIQKKITNRDNEIMCLLREKEKFKKDLRSEKNKMCNVTERNKFKERRLYEYIRQLENVILDHKQENYRLYSEHLLNETQKQIELFVEKETMFNNFRHTQDLFDELQSQYMTFVNSLLLENKNLRNDIERIDASYCRQLGDLRSVINGINDSMANQVWCATKEQNRLNVEHSQFLRNKSREIQMLENSIVEERNLNKKLNDEILGLQEKIRRKDECIQKEIWKTAEETRNKIIVSNDLSELKLENEKLIVKSNQTQVQFKNFLISTQKTNVKLQSAITNLKSKKRQVNDILSKLRNYFPTVVKALSLLKLKTEELTTLNANQNIQLNDVLKTEQITKVKLQDEITRLKNEKLHVNDSLNHLENCLPTIVKVFAELKSNNEKLTAVNANQMIRLQNVLATEQRTNIKLRDEVIYLKNEKKRIDDWWKLELQKRIAETGHQITEVNKNGLNRLIKTIGILEKREQHLIGMLEEKSNIIKDKNQLLELKDREIRELKYIVEDLNCRLAEQNPTGVKNVKTKNIDLSAHEHEKRMKIINDAKIHQHAVNKSSGDHVANVNGRHFSETSKHKSNYYTDLDRLESHNTVETTYRVVREERRCTLSKYVIKELDKELTKKINTHPHEPTRTKNKKNHKI